MYKVLVIIFFISFLPLSVYAQSIKIKSVVYSKESYTPLSFANIGIVNKFTATITNEKGYFEIEVAATDTLVFSMVGYQTLKVVAGQCRDEVLMEAQNFQLPEIVIQPGKFTNIEIGFHRGRQTGKYIGCPQLAVFINNPVKIEGIVQKVHFWMGWENPAFDWQILKVRIRVYKRDSVSGLPSTDILTQQIMVDIAREKVYKKHIEIDLKNYHILFPDEGAFIGLDLIGFIDTQGSFIKYMDRRQHLYISSTEVFPDIYTYTYALGQWQKGSSGRYRGLNNARFGVEVKFPAQ